ncbi:MAG: HD-GYP domain-containing protein [Nitrosomonadales bacterium]|nr:HD-GYP domain-containing protein [Nitrosomonadales bacterium]
MLKRIPVKQLRIGMYIHEFCGSWYDHPFWRNAFILDKSEDLQEILSTGIKEVWIDTGKGLDVESGEGGKSEKAVAAEVDSALARADTGNKIVRHADITQEAERAVKICAKSKQAVTFMFKEARMGKALNASDALPIVEEITTSVARNPGALISLARLKDKDNYTYMHSVAVCALMVALARQLGLDEEQTRQAGMAGLMHDIGKTMIPPEIINKPGKLTEAEFQVMKNHPIDGHIILLESKGISDIARHVCLRHHEKVDGSGYPDKLADGKIDMYAKMGAVCDVYDAISSIRAYKNGWEPAQSIRKMAEWSHGHFDWRIFEAFVRSMGIYPVGSMVRLSSDRLGVVIGQAEQSLLTPKVKVFFSIKSNTRITHEILDLSNPACKDKIVSHEDPAKWHISDIQELWSDVSAAPW